VIYDLNDEEVENLDPAFWTEEERAEQISTSEEMSEVSELTDA